MLSICHVFQLGSLIDGERKPPGDIINLNRSLTALQVNQEVNDTKRILCVLRERQRRLDEKVKSAS